MKTQREFENWQDFHLAYLVAQNGTLSSVALLLDVHHSTVLRRINGLEKRLNTRLFYRHQRGYELTDAGKLLLACCEDIESRFGRLIGELQGADQQITGSLTITSVGTFGARLMPIFARFQQQNPQIQLEFVAEGRVLRLERGEAHISIRPGKPPQHLDYIGQKVGAMAMGLYASKAYIDKYGLPSSPKDWPKHRFVGGSENIAFVPFIEWIDKNVASQNVVFRASSVESMLEGICSGMGVGLVNNWVAQSYPDLVPITVPIAGLDVDLWLVTHKDVHRSAKIQTFNQFFKQQMQKEQGIALY